METSVFIVKTTKPDDALLADALGGTYALWCGLKSFVLQHFTGITEEWNYSKAGWNARLKDKKRVVIYLMPKDGYFKASFVFGEKATSAAQDSDIDGGIKEAIMSAPVYGEGRGFRIDVHDRQTASDIEKLLLIKKQF